MPTCRLLPNLCSPGSTNMALDEALLRSALDRGVATLRFYTWTEPTLSLGYFQAGADRLADARVAGLAWVRRPTGGAAILHHQEITYSLALPPGRPWHGDESWLCRFHHAIQAALRSFGIESRAVLCGEEKKLGPFLCFLHQTPGDLLIDGRKVVGSAQRRPHLATMQHGSILLRQSPHTPDLPGIGDLSGASVGAAELAGAIVAELGRSTGWTFDPDDWTDAERQTASELEQTRYATPAWNEKR